MNYTELQTKVASWLHRTDLAAAIPGFIELAEERLNRDLRVRQMEVALEVTPITGNRIAVPDGTVGVKTLWVPGALNHPLLPQSFEAVLSMPATGRATYYAWQGDDFYFNGSGDVQGVLYQAIPALSDTNPSNWLIDAHPSVYLLGAMLEAGIYTKDPDMAVHAQRFHNAIAAITGADMRDRFGGPLVARAR